MDFIVTINDPAQLAGITWAREEYNKTLPPPMPPPPIPPDTVSGALYTNGDLVASPTETFPPPLETDEEYVQFVMENAAISYADQKLRQEHRQNYEDAANAAGRKII